jgi:hypothetical protein
MRYTGYLALALLGAATLAGGPAYANVCQAETMSCSTGMPVDGYCECTAHGRTEGGTVVSKAAPHHAMSSAAGGCGAHPNAPGCP